MQPLGMHDRRVLNGSSAPRPTCPRRNNVDSDYCWYRRFDVGCQQDMSARCHAFMFRQWYNRTDSQNRICCGTRSQWSLWSSRDTWSDFLAEKTSRGIQDWL